MPAPTIESPLTRARNVEAGCRNKCRVRSNGASRWSSAGEANPAGTGQPNNGNSCAVSRAAARKLWREVGIMASQRMVD